MTFLFHEQLARSAENMARLTRASVTVCGAGALGANLVETLARSGVGQLTVIDFDRVELRNLSTQPYHRADIGALKAKMLANTVYRAVGTPVTPVTQRLTAENAQKLLRDPDLVIDAFDNSVARQAVKMACAAQELPCVHAGLGGDYAKVVWEPGYRVPSAVNDDVCDYPLARNLVMLTVAIAAESAIRFLTTGQNKGYTLTFNDLAIQATA